MAAKPAKKPAAIKDPRDGAGGGSLGGPRNGMLAGGGGVTPPVGPRPPASAPKPAWQTPQLTRKFTPEERRIIDNHRKGNLGAPNQSDEWILYTVSPTTRKKPGPSLAPRDMGGTYVPKPEHLKMRDTQMADYKKQLDEIRRSRRGGGRGGAGGAAAPAAGGAIAGRNGGRGPVDGTTPGGQKPGTNIKVSAPNMKPAGKAAASAGKSVGNAGKAAANAGKNVSNIKMPSGTAKAGSNVKFNTGKMKQNKNLGAFGKMFK